MARRLFSWAVRGTSRGVGGGADGAVSDGVAAGCASDEAASMGGPVGDAPAGGDPGWGSAGSCRLAGRSSLLPGCVGSVVWRCSMAPPTIMAPELSRVSQNPAPMNETTFGLPIIVELVIAELALWSTVTSPMVSTR